MRLTLIVLLLHLYNWAQEPLSAIKPTALNTKNELGISLLSLSYIGEGSLPLYSYLHVLPGIYYKRHFGQGALRFSFNYYQNNLNQLRSPQSSYIGNAAISRLEQMNIGYQLKFGHKRLSPFLYFDTFVSFKQDQTWMDHYVDAQTTKVGWETGGGLQYRLSRHLALCYEFSFKCSWDLIAFSPIKQLGLSFTF